VLLLSLLLPQSLELGQSDNALNKS